MQAFANNHFVCFSSQKLPYGGASVFVYGVLAHHHNIIKSPKRTNPPWTFWYASSKHIPYSNKLPSQFVTNTPYVSPLKNCRTVVRQFLYYGVRVPTTRNNKNSEADIYLLRYFGTPEGTRTPDLLVRSQSLYPAELQAHFSNSFIIISSKLQYVNPFLKVFSNFLRKSYFSQKYLHRHFHCGIV